MSRTKMALLSFLVILLPVLSLFFSTASEANFFTFRDGQTSSSRGSIFNAVSSSFIKMAENKQFVLYVNPSSLGIKVLNKKTGHLWNGSMEETDKNLNQVWQFFFQSGVTVEYMDEKQKIRQASILGEKADIILREAQNGFSAEVSFKKLGFHLTLQVTLNEDSLVYRIPSSSIQEKNDKNKIEAIYVFPYLGATKGLQKEGYLFIPDGSGALINLKEQTIAKQPYIGRVFGQDLGLKGVSKGSDFTLVRDSEQIYLPVYGVSDGRENGIVTLLKEGAPFAEIRAYPSGVTTEYNWVTTKWIYRETYFQPVDKKGNGITVNQKLRNQFSATAQMMFLSGEDSDYVGMAKRVQKELVQEGVLSRKDSRGDSLPIHLEFIAAENKKELLGGKVIPMTTLQQMDSILEDLRKNQVDQMRVVMRGWTKNGVSGSSPTLFSLETRLGDEKEWEAIIEKYVKMGIPLYFNVDFMFADRNGKGYRDKDIAQAISEQLLLFEDGASYLEPQATKRLLAQEISQFQQHGISHLAVDTIGQTLYSSFGTPVTPRDEAIKLYQSIFADHPDIKFSFYTPNSYLWKYAEDILEIPMGSSNYLLESESVPFLQIILKGYVDYYAPASNFEADPRKGLLRLIDYGALPSFYLTEKDPIELLDTGTQWLYTSQYKVWRDEILHEYQQVREALLPVKGATYVSRKEIVKGVILNTYSNGVSILINYTEKDFALNEKVVLAGSFLVIGGIKE